MEPARGRASIAVVVGCLVVIGACGGHSTKSAAATKDVEVQLGFDQHGLQARQRQVEDLVRDCMKAQGFEYVPVDPAAQQAALVGTADLSDDDFKRQFGYGISTLYEKRAAQVGDPNARRREALSSPADRAAYDRALRGDEVDATFADAIDTGDFTHLGGCTKKAADKVFGGAGVVNTIQQKLDDLDERVNDDPRMVAALGRWRACVRDAGYSFAQPDDIDVYLKDKLTAIVGPSDAATPDYDHAALAALQREELAIGKADFGCEDKVVKPVEDKVRPEYDRTFREQNGGLLQRAGRS